MVVVVVVCVCRGGGGDIMVLYKFFPLPPSVNMHAKQNSAKSLCASGQESNVIVIHSSTAKCTRL